MFDETLSNCIKKGFVKTTFGIILVQHILNMFIQTTLFLQKVLEFYLLMLDGAPSTCSIFMPGDTHNPDVTLC